MLRASDYVQVEQWVRALALYEDMHAQSPRADVIRAAPPSELAKGKQQERALASIEDVLMALRQASMDAHVAAGGLSISPWPSSYWQLSSASPPRCVGKCGPLQANCSVQAECLYIGALWSKVREHRPPRCTWRTSATSRTKGGVQPPVAPTIGSTQAARVREHQATPRHPVNIGHHQVAWRRSGIAASACGNCA